MCWHLVIGCYIFFFGRPRFFEEENFCSSNIGDIFVCEQLDLVQHFEFLKMLVLNALDVGAEYSLKLNNGLGELDSSTAESQTGAGNLKKNSGPSPSSVIFSSLILESGTDRMTCLKSS